MYQSNILLNDRSFPSFRRAITGFSMTLMLCASGSLFAQSEIKGKHYGAKVPSAEELVEELTPKPKYKTRGIQFGQAPANVPKTKPSVSLAINFAHDSYQLTDSALQQLAPLGEALKSNKLSEFRFQIQGHTDSSGTENYNMGLSQKRALAVGNFLNSNYGISADRLKLSGKGESELYDPKNPTSGVNRRVQITTLSD